MRKDYHMHPTVLKAPGRFDLFVQKALACGIGEICVTDHMPLSISGAKDRIRAGEVKNYCRRVRELAEKYEGILRIKCGIEIDYHPSALAEIESVLEDGTFDFILASSHMHVFIGDFENYTFSDFAKAALENSLKAAETGWFHALSHLDMYRFAFENPHRFPLIKNAYSPEMNECLIKELLDTVVRRGMFLEINPHLAEAKQDLSFVYPAEPIARWALEKNVQFSYGSDVHNPDSVGVYLEVLENHPVYGKALKQWEDEV